MKKIPLLIALISCLHANSQSLSPVVIGSSGDFYSSPTFSLSSTTGEMTMVETFSATSGILTQGFHQPNDIFVGIEHHPSISSSISFNIYPNPASDHLTVLSVLDEPGSLLFRLFNDIGQLVFIGSEKSSTSGRFEATFDLEKYVSGIYFLQVNFTSISNRHVAAEQKISIIK